MKRRTAIQRNAFAEWVTRASRSRCPNLDMHENRCPWTFVDHEEFSTLIIVLSPVLHLYSICILLGIIWAWIRNMQYVRKDRWCLLATVSAASSCAGEAHATGYHMATAASKFRMFKKFTTTVQCPSFWAQHLPLEEQGPSLHLQLNDLKEQVPVLDVSAKMCLTMQLRRCMATVPAVGTPFGSPTVKAPTWSRSETMGSCRAGAVAGGFAELLVAWKVRLLKHETKVIKMAGASENAVGSNEVLNMI